MRIVGGILKGRSLVSFNEQNIRPTSDMVRESLFNILRYDIEGTSFLDLFAGTGAVGIEAYSRGAKKVVLNDISKESLTVIKKNLDKCKITDKSVITVTASDAEEFVKRTEKFDIVYIDPPYKSDVIERLLKYLPDILSENGIAIIETEKPFSFNGTNYGLEIYDTRKYGRARLAFLRKENV